MIISVFLLVIWSGTITVSANSPLVYTDINGDGSNYTGYIYGISLYTAPNYASKFPY